MGKGFWTYISISFNDFFSPFTFKLSPLKIIITMSGYPGEKDIIYSPGRG